MSRQSHARPQIASTVRTSPSCHAGSLTPNTAASLPQSSLESGGRVALVGHSAVAIGATAGTASPCRAAAANVAIARSCQVVPPVPAAW